MFCVKHLKLLFFCPSIQFSFSFSLFNVLISTPLPPLGLFISLPSLSLSLSRISLLIDPTNHISMCRFVSIYLFL